MTIGETFAGPPIWGMLRFPHAQWRSDLADTIRDAHPQIAAKIDEGYVYTPLDTVIPFHAAHGDPETRFVLAVFGRQASKSTAQRASLWQDVWLPDNEHGSPRVWVGADQTANTQKIWTPFLNDIDNLPIELRTKFHHVKQEGIITIDAGTFHNGWPMEITKKSGENPAKWVGDPVRSLHIDEGQQTPDAAIFNALPALRSGHGQMFATGVAEIDYPDVTWWQSFCLRGDDPNDPEYQTMRAPSWAAPWQDRAEVEKDRASLGDELWNARYGGIFPERSGAVFPEVYLNRFFRSGLQLHPDPISGARYAAGLDVASGGDDFTVLSIADRRSREVIFAKAYPRVEQSIQVDEVQEDLHRFGNPRVRVDGTVIGAYWCTDLRGYGCQPIPYEYSGRGKAHLIEDFRRAVERELITCPKIETLRNEMRLFKRSDTRNQYGVYAYNAPKGFHDDWVNSVALLAKELGAGRAARSGSGPARRRSRAYA